MNAFECVFCPALFPTVLPLEHFHPMYSSPSSPFYVNTVKPVIFIMCPISKRYDFQSAPFVPLSPALSPSTSINLSFCHSPLFHRLPSSPPVCAPWHSFRPSYPSGGDVRPGLIDQAINYPCIPSALLAACLASRPRPYGEGREGWDAGSEAGRERVPGKLLIKYESIVCHLSGHASSSPLEGDRETWRGRGSVEGKGKNQ